MLKHKAIIDKLTAEQKLSLAASVRSFSSPWAKDAGFLPVRISDMKQINAEHGAPFPSFSALANSWNLALTEEAAREYACLARKNAVDLLFTPRLGVQCNPFCEGISEDPYQAGKMAAAVLRGASAAGVKACLANVSVGERDIAALDKEFDPRALYEYYLAPWRAMDKTGDAAAAFSYTKVSGSYAETNVTKIDAFLHESNAVGQVIAERCDLGRDAICLKAGNILLDGDADTLKSALESDVNGKKELSEDELDEAVDRAISLMEECGAAKANVCEPNETFALRAATESAVLLKNEGVLPLRKDCRVAVIGHPEGVSAGEFFENLKEYGAFQGGGFAAGYLLAQSRSDEEIPHALEIAAKADAVLLFLRHEPENEETGRAARAKFSANRLALSEALAKVNRNVIAVVPPESPLDLGFEQSVAALLLAETKSGQSGEALLDLLSGKVSPSGKLAATRYINTDERFAALSEDKKAGRCRVGTFLGYRRYDAAGEYPPFPFGFGLTYSSFGYSDLKAENGNVSFTLRNKGKFDAAEVVQMYVGKPDSAAVRPRKELKAFQKVFLRAGESARLTFPVDRESLGIYNDGGFAVEDGAYRVYIAASACDVRLETTVHVPGGKLAPDGRNIAEYIPSLTNIFAGNYTLGPVVRPFRWREMLRTALILMIVGFGLAVISSLLGVSGAFMYSDIINSVVLPIIMIFVGAPLFLAGLVVLIVALVKKKRAGKAAFVQVSAGSAAVQTEVSPELSYEKLFEAVLPKDEKNEKAKAQQREESVDTLKFCDASVTFSLVCERLAAFFAERGISIGRKGARKILSAFSASRLIVLKSGALPAKFFKTLSDFFGSGLYLHECGERDESGAARSNAARAFQDAESHRHLVHVAAWSGANAEQIASAAAPFQFYFENPARAANCAADEVIHSPNVWFVFAAVGGGASAFPENACLIDLECEETPQTESDVPAGALNYYQFCALMKDARGEYCLDEDKCWKKIDRLETFAGIQFGNKAWTRLEKFSSAYLACGGEAEETLDCALAAVILPFLRRFTPEEQTVALENIFGAENIAECKKTLSAEPAKEGL